MIERLGIAIARAFPNQWTFLRFPEVLTVNSEIAAAGIDVDGFDFDCHCPTSLAQFRRNRNFALTYPTDRPNTSRVHFRLRHGGLQHILAHDPKPGQRALPAAKGLLKARVSKTLSTHSPIARSEQVLNGLLNVGCLPRAQCHLARNDMHISGLPQPNPTIRSEPIISPDTFPIVSYPRLHPYKRVHYFVGAAGLRGDRNVHFTHMGVGPKCGHPHDRIRARGGEQSYTLISCRSDVTRTLSGRDIAAPCRAAKSDCTGRYCNSWPAAWHVPAQANPASFGPSPPGVTGLTFAHAIVSAHAESLRTLASDSYRCQRFGKVAHKTF